MEISEILNCILILIILCCFVFSYFLVVNALMFKSKGLKKEADDCTKWAFIFHLACGALCLLLKKIS